MSQSLFFLYHKREMLEIIDKSLLTDSNKSIMRNWIAELLSAFESFIRTKDISSQHISEIYSQINQYKNK